MEKLSVDLTLRMTPDRLMDVELELKHLTESLKLRSSSTETVEIPGRGLIYSFHNPDGIEAGDLLDKDHMPRVTNFTDLIFSTVFNDLRGEDPNIPSPAVEVGGDPNWLSDISSIASIEESYKVESQAGRINRRMYLNRGKEGARKLLEMKPLGDDEVLVPVVRCGANIFPEGHELEAKRLRFDGLPELLGAGINLSPEDAMAFEGKSIRIGEGVIASGSTEIILILALKGWEAIVKEVSCDAVIVCPSGAVLVDEVRKVLGIGGIDRGVFVGGVLDDDWYVRYHVKDPLLKIIKDPRAESFVGKQVLGDGGDLTSNTE